MPRTTTSFQTILSSAFLFWFVMLVKGHGCLLRCSNKGTKRERLQGERDNLVSFIFDSKEENLVLVVLAHLFGSAVIFALTKMENHCKSVGNSSIIVICGPSSPVHKRIAFSHKSPVKMCICQNWVEVWLE